MICLQGKTVWLSLHKDKKNKVTKWFSNSIPRYLSKIHGSICSHKSLCMNIHSRLIQISPLEKQPKWSTNVWINKTRYTHTVRYYLGKKETDSKGLLMDMDGVSFRGWWNFEIRWWRWFHNCLHTSHTSEAILPSDKSSLVKLEWYFIFPDLSPQSFTTVISGGSLESAFL